MDDDYGHDDELARKLKNEGFQPDHYVQHLSQQRFNPATYGKQEIELETKSDVESEYSYFTDDQNEKQADPI